MRLWILAVLPLAACSDVHGEAAGQAIAAGGSGTSRSYAVAGFTKVDLRGSDNVEVSAGPNFAVSAKGDPKLLDQLEIVKDGDTLRIGRKDHTGWSIDSRRNARVDVVMPHLTGASVSGSGDMEVARAEGDFAGSVTGSGNLTVKAIEGSRAMLSASGSGGIFAAGRADQLHASIAGSGDIDSRALKAARGDVSIVGSGNLRATVAGPVSVSLVGSGNADIGGGARCTVSKIGSGEARCG